MNQCGDQAPMFIGHWNHIDCIGFVDAQRNIEIKNSHFSCTECCFEILQPWKYLWIKATYILSKNNLSMTKKFFNFGN